MFVIEMGELWVYNGGIIGSWWNLIEFELMEGKSIE